jgi:hypothetical protein
MGRPWGRRAKAQPLRNRKNHFSSSRHQYVYQEGNAWVSRPTPPQVAVNVLLASPSVHMSFHDSPATHHAETVRRYPRNYAPPERGRDGRGPGG